MNPSPKVLSIGLDGGTFDLMDSWIDQGLLPNIGKLIGHGVKAPLNSVILPYTPQAWGSFMTGMNPGNHGVFGFKEKADGRYSFQFVNNRSIRSKTLWEYLSDHDKRSILVNIPMTFPPEEINGIIVGGMDAPGVDSDFTFPGHVKDEIFRIVPDYVIHLHVGAGFLDSDSKRRKAADELIRMVACREKLVLHFMEQHPWDFFAVNFSAIDQVQHHFWKYLDSENEFRDVILDVYKRVDVAIGKILECVPPETRIFLMSDHGAGPASPYVIFIDEWLRENGLLDFKKSFSARGVATKLLKWALTASSQKLSSKVKDQLMKWMPGMREKSQGYVRRALIDWTKTRVFSGEHPATLRINLKGRDALGVVPQAEYEELRDRLVEKLEGMTHPDTGERLIEKVYKREDLYHGDHITSAPDLVLCPGDFAHQIKGGPFSSRAYERVVSSKDQKEFFVNGVHRLNGIFVANGSGIKENLVLPTLSITDLFPTFLYCLGLGVPAGLDGKVVESLFEMDHLSTHPPQASDQSLKRGSHISETGVTYEEDDSEKIAESLRGLGYID